MASKSRHDRVEDERPPRASIILPVDRQSDRAGKTVAFEAKEMSPRRDARADSARLSTANPDDDVSAAAGMDIVKTKSASWVRDRRPREDPGLAPRAPSRCRSRSRLVARLFRLANTRGDSAVLRLGGDRVREVAWLGDGPRSDPLPVRLCSACRLRVGCSRRTNTDSTRRRFV